MLRARGTPLDKCFRQEATAVKMRLLKAIILGIIFGTLGWITGAHAEGSAPAILSFEEWKLKQIESAQVTYNVAHVDHSLRSRAGSGRVDKKSLELQSRVDQAKLNLEMAKDLALHDYFVLYAAQLKTKEDFKALVDRLSPEEAAVLLKAYAERILEQQNQLPSVPQGQNALLMLNQ
jgi:hypothetical protein